MGRVRDIKCIHKQGDVIFHVLVHLNNTQDERCASPVKRLICLYGSGITHSFMNTSHISLDTVSLVCLLSFQSFHYLQSSVGLRATEREISGVA